MDELKIDTAFVRNMDRDPVDAKLVRSMIELAHNLGFGVVAEGRGERSHLGAAARAELRAGAGLPHGPADAGREFLAWSARWVDKRRLLGGRQSAGLLH